MPDEMGIGPTVAALSTPAAPAGLGVLRVSGREALAVASRVFRPANPARALDRQPGYTASYGLWPTGRASSTNAWRWFFGRRTAIPERTWWNFPATAALICWLAPAGAVRCGRRAGRAGRIHPPAFLNGKLDLTGAEAVMALIAADGQLAARQPWRRGKGRCSAGSAILSGD